MIIVKMKKIIMIKYDNENYGCSFISDLKWQNMIMKILQRKKKQDLEDLKKDEFIYVTYSPKKKSGIILKNQHRYTSDPWVLRT